LPSCLRFTTTIHPRFFRQGKSIVKRGLGGLVCGFFRGRW